MAEIGAHIKEILKYEDSVIIQGLGAFITSYKSAQIKSKTGSISPPTKDIRFNDKQKEDNGRLVSYICERDKITEAEARRLIENFVHDTNIKLNAGQHVRIPDLGYLYKDKAYKIQFVYDAAENILLESYGLQEIEWDMKAEGKSKPIPESKETSLRKRKMLVIPIFILVVVILVMSILITSKLKMSGEHDFAFNGWFSGSENQEGDITTISNEIDSLNNRNHALMPVEDKYAGFSKFYLVGGSFSIYNNAVKYKDELVAKGYNAELLEVDGKIFRVSLKTYTNRNEALVDLDRLQDVHKDRTLWILNAN